MTSIQVYARVRPTEDNENCIITSSNNSVIVKCRLGDKTFPLDRVFDQPSSQKEVYSSVASNLVRETVSGFNCTLFAYGQTGTGKTHTMVGQRCNPQLPWVDDPAAGIIPRAIADIFYSLHEGASKDFSVRISFLEIYNENLTDLLYGGVNAPRLRIYDGNVPRSGSGGNAVRVENLSEVAVNSVEQALELLQKGLNHRQTAATLMNQHSSRSHAVFSIQTLVRNTEEVVVGKFHLVDLAGSECIGRSGATDGRAREAGKINASLLTLQRVVNCLLVKGQGHVPFRDSKLTRLLQDSLGGNSKTAFIATISPSNVNAEESLNTLAYALKAKCITNRPTVNLRTEAGVLQDLIAENALLRQDLAAARETQVEALVGQGTLQKMRELETRCSELQQELEAVQIENESLRVQCRQAEDTIASISVPSSLEVETLERLQQSETRCRELQRQLEMCLESDARSREAVSDMLQQQVQRLDSVGSLVHHQLQGASLRLENVAVEVEHCRHFLEGALLELDKQLEVELQPSLSQESPTGLESLKIVDEVRERLTTHSTEVRSVLDAFSNKVVNAIAQWREVADSGMVLLQECSAEMAPLHGDLEYEIKEATERLQKGQEDIRCVWTAVSEEMRDVVRIVELDPATSNFMEEQVELERLEGELLTSLQGLFRRRREVRQGFQTQHKQEMSERVSKSRAVLKRQEMLQSDGFMQTQREMVAALRQRFDRVRTGGRAIADFYAQRQQSQKATVERMAEEQTHATQELLASQSGRLQAAVEECCNLLLKTQFDLKLAAENEKQENRPPNTQKQARDSVTKALSLVRERLPQVQQQATTAVGECKDAELQCEDSLSLMRVLVDDMPLVCLPSIPLKVLLAPVLGGNSSDVGNSS